MTQPTPHRDLHGGRPIWQDHRVKLPPRRKLARDRRCDVLVVGAGISGALVAEALAGEFDVLVCDRRTPLQGSTAASTAMLLHEIDTPLLRLSQRLGRAAAERIWRRSVLAVQALHDRTRALHIDADLRSVRSLYLQGTQLDARGLEREADVRSRAGINVEYLDAAAVRNDYGIRRRAALRSGATMTADPRALAAGFLRAAVTRGAELLVPEEVVRLDSLRRGRVRAQLRSGHQVLARQVVMATGYELSPQVPAAGHRIVSTWAITTTPQRREPWPGGDVIWEASDPYLYLRTTPDGRVICGGGDEEIADPARRDARLEQKTRWLQRRLGVLLPQVHTRLSHAWSGSFGASRDGLPTIGAVPRLRNVHAVLGYGGNGITFSMMAAQMLRNVITGAGDDDLALVRFRKG